MSAYVEDPSALVGERTRALVLVTPNNPTGMQYADAYLEDAAKLMTDDGCNIAHVINEKGKPTGVLTLPDVIDAMVTPATHDEDERVVEAAE